MLVHVGLEFIEGSLAVALGSAIVPPWLAREWIPRKRSGEPNWTVDGGIGAGFR